VLTPVPAASLGRLAAERLLRALETGAIPVGSRLVEARLAASLGVSRGPVRDALQYLEQQGLVRRLPHRGSFAATLAPEELVDIFILRADLEALAARLAVVRRAIHGRDLAALRECVAAMARAVRARRFDELLDLDIAFHRLLAERSGHRRLVVILDGLRAHTRIAIALANKNARALAGVVETHRNLVAAIESEDMRRVDLESKQHVLETLDYLGLDTPTLAADGRALTSPCARPPRRRQSGVATDPGDAPRAPPSPRGRDRRPQRRRQERRDRSNVARSSSGKVDRLSDSSRIEPGLR